MPATSTLLLFLPSLLLLSRAVTLVSPALVLESGYSITTVIDFNQHHPPGGSDAASVRPFALQPLARSQNLLLLLDSSRSTFYSVRLPLSQESEVSLLSGGGSIGFSDGDATSASFNHPRDFAVDSRDNVYVADRINHAIRKISSSSGMTTTIAGGYSRKSGHTDGPAQNATFSVDFDLVYMPKMCALLISDRGNRLIRQMDLKPEDCEDPQQSGKGLGAIPVCFIAAMALLFGLAFGFISRPFVTSLSNVSAIAGFFMSLKSSYELITLFLNAT
ncbi:hypothetical protein AXF42_Ash002871 [Apostasia shenzhenica]|uniref:Non-specific serine/threonine protein kinase n=1 Tax=Apostasia shenzhenica TaxID=1088818 RepID=A0A2I0A7M2_9ASPA|nr:hypothetical protein AXF42_Ash002871 [Apostasia shenzhenica]